jgi:hypothetical protein
MPQTPARAPCGCAPVSAGARITTIARRAYYRVKVNKPLPPLPIGECCAHCCAASSGSAARSRPYAFALPSLMRFPDPRFISPVPFVSPTPKMAPTSAVLPTPAGPRSCPRALRARSPSSGRALLPAGARMPTIRTSSLNSVSRLTNPCRAGGSQGRKSRTAGAGDSGPASACVARCSNSKNRTGDRKIGQASDRYRSEIGRISVGNRTALRTIGFRTRTCAALDARHRTPRRVASRLRRLRRSMPEGARLPAPNTGTFAWRLGCWTRRRKGSPPDGLAAGQRGAGRKVGAGSHDRRGCGAMEGASVGLE